MYNFSTKMLNLLPPETAHELAIKMLRLYPISNVLNDIDLCEFAQNLMGMEFPHPLGLAAGFDKHANVFDKLGQLGFSFVEVGSVTPKPQPGNPRPRLFRLLEQQAIINRYGFNSKGLAYFSHNLKKHSRTNILGVNLGKNKETTHAQDDFLESAEALIKLADYFTINISSPNTPGLRDLQTPEALKPIIDGIHAIGKRVSREIPIFIKISPDLDTVQETKLAEFLAGENIAGIIICNTTINHEGIKESKFAHEQGGLSGPPLKIHATNMIRRIYHIVPKDFIIIGCGGISSGQDAYEKLRAGAHLLQFYTAFIFEGPLVLRKILLELKALCARDGVRHIKEVIGADVK